MRYTIIYLSLLATTTISCNYALEREEQPAADTIRVDTVDSRTEVLDTVKKKRARNQYISRCAA